MEKSIGYEFIEKTKYKYLGPAPQQKGVAPPELQIDFSRGNRRIELPQPPETDFKRLVDSRCSTRAYSPSKISKEELSYLLWCTQGVKYVEPNLHTLRTVPSAGARHAFETFILANRVENLEPLLYQYLALEHKLAIISHDNRMAEKIAYACLGQKMPIASAATFIWIADVERMIWRYSDRGYRYIFLDAGHICQNLYLAAETISCGVCSIGAFDDDMLNETLGLDGRRHFVVYLACVGKKR